MKSWRSCLGLLIVFFLTSLGAAPASAQGHGGSGDLFGDLVHIKRDVLTGQPILQKRMIEYPTAGVDWGYCPIPIDAYGIELPMVDLNCDVDPAAADRLVEVDYFGRLSAGRTREANLRMHFDEAIDNIKAAEAVGIDGAGRLQLGTGCTSTTSCATWNIVDSPLENLSLYHRLMKYGHIQTDPLEEDTSSHGDPAAGTVYHPALGPADYAKFSSAVLSLLPYPSSTPCFTGGTTFVAACAARQSLTAEDFVRAASFLGGAADKHGRMTADLVQYLNRILRITLDTAGSLATLNTVPALIRDENGSIAPAASGLPAPADERFVDFTPALYFRDTQFNRPVVALVTAGVGMWREDSGVSLLPFLRYINGAMTAPATNMTAFVRNGSDAQRACEFVHNYAVPLDIWAVGAATTTTVAGTSVPFSAAAQTIALQATVSDGVPVQAGTVMFSLLTADGIVVGTPTASGTVTDGVAQANYVLPANTPQQSLVILAAYSGGTGFAPSYGVGTLTIAAAATVTTVAAVGAPLSSTPQTVPLVGTVTTANSSPINEGVVTFAVRDSGGIMIGAPVAAPVVSNMSTALFLLPSGLPAQRLSVSADYGGTANFLASSGTGVLTVGCPTVLISPAVLPHAVIGQTYSQQLTFSGTAPVTVTNSGTLPAGLTLSSGGLLSGVPEVAGVYPFTVSATDGIGCTGTRSYTLYVDPPSTFVTGNGPGSVARVRTFQTSGAPATGPATDFIAYDSAFQGGVRVALGDVTGDGVPDRITGAGPSGGPHVTVVDGATGGAVRSFSAFPDVPPGGIFVASGDVDNDGRSDIIVGRGSAPATIRVFSGRTTAMIRELTAFAPHMPDGVRVASADMNADGYAEVIAGAGAGSLPSVQVFDGASGAAAMTFEAYTAAFGGGVFVGAADVTGDGFPDIITGAGEGGGPHVRVFDGTTNIEHAGFYAFDAAFAGGVRVAGADLNRDGRAEIITSMGPGGVPGVRVFDGHSKAMISEFLAYDSTSTAGVFVAGNGPMARLSVDSPLNGSVVSSPFAVGGWAFNEAAVTGTGVDAIHVWAYPNNGAAPFFLGAATVGGERPDVAAVFGDQWRYSGFHLIATPPPGVYDVVVFVHTDVTGTFNNRQVLRVTVQ